MNSVIDLRSQCRPEIDGLRASALLAGIVNHFNSTLLPSGFLGIAIFLLSRIMLSLGRWSLVVGCGGIVFAGLSFSAPRSRLLGRQCAQKKSWSFQGL